MATARRTPRRDARGGGGVLPARLPRRAGGRGGDPPLRPAPPGAALRRHADVLGPARASMPHGSVGGSRAAELFEEGFARLLRRSLPRPRRVPAADARFPPASPMLANLGAFLGSLLYGLPGILPSARRPARPGPSGGSSCRRAGARSRWSGCGSVAVPLAWSPGMGPTTRPSSSANGTGSARVERPPRRAISGSSRSTTRARGMTELP